MPDSIRLDIPADLLVPASGSGPGIVLFQEIFGVRPSRVASESWGSASAAGSPTTLR